MSCQVEGQREAVCFSQLRNKCEKILAAIKVEHLVAVSLVFVLLDYFHRDVQQPDGRQRVRLLSPVVYPPSAVISLRDVVRLQPFQIGKRQSGECREDEHVPDELKLWFLNRNLHQFFQVLQFHVAAFAPGKFRVQSAIGVPAERSLAHGPHGHLLQPVQMFMYRLGAHVAVYA